ncbi:acetyl-CoA acetyltransferase [Corynebacterium mustelae]|uniref:Probable acetyl-CoA acetyltransferase n=1 Tax=Corynebacterium mustelae TaxID=571915 RepID=A0A0G3GW48_9CORY|nr:acetyl-CoA C-acyltransferase [Corynebacterium mustelae]AKK05384.1 acetyl-CoA acetyltransferase [Corynebacterium mustelae]
MTHQGSDVVIVGAARTPFGKLLGGLSDIPATQLGAIAIRGALEQAKVPGDKVDAVIMGQVLQAGVGQNPAKQAALGAGIQEEAHTLTINKVCLSGLTAVIDAARLLRTGEAQVVVAGGMESMSLAPHLLVGARRGYKYGSAATEDHMAFDALSAAGSGESMGALTESFSLTYPLDRQEQDECAARSHQRAHAAHEAGLFDAEIVPVRTKAGELRADEGVRPDSSVLSLSGLRPAFTPDGTITAGNSSQITDGAAACVLTTRGMAEKTGWPILATVRAPGQIAGPDHSLQAKPARALEVALARQGWDIADLDVVEINEAFAAVAIYSAKELGIDVETINTEGGAIALGHPVGASGARLVVHAAHMLHQKRGTKAGLALCGGGGQGEALLLEA